ncbi:MAG: ABC transporter ATP-binding protein [Haloferacaceae archaeon]|jgi:ABC-type branched-subunit amino acid transport system ATPase component
MAQFEIENVHAGYGDLSVLQGVDMTVDEGEIVCIIGPNGAGKSTLFRVIYGLLAPTSGAVRYRGESVLGLSQKELLRQGIAYILQRDAVFPDMTVRENLEMGAYVAPEVFDLDARVEEMYGLFPVLEEKGDKKAGTLSGGQRQMLEFARGLILDPELVLLDEPTAGLAPKIIDQVFAKVKEINDTGVTVLMIEQNVKTGLSYADRAYVLENGQTRFSGPADSILDEPAVRDAYLGGAAGESEAQH